jgi:hypothetical protein
MKLNQVIAIEKGIKSKAHSELTELHKICQKPELFSGFNKMYQKQNEADEELPSESKKVQQKIADVLRNLAGFMTEYLDISATKSYANMGAKADVNINGNILLKDVPVTFLLDLEKTLTDLYTFFDKLPEISDSENWVFDSNNSIWKTVPNKTHRTKKTQRPVVLYPATPEHPAQTQLITEDVLVGFWHQELHSGAASSNDKQTLTKRVSDLLKAVKVAREEANSIDATKREVGEKLFEYLFTP